MISDRDSSKMKTLMLTHEKLIKIVKKNEDII